MDYKERVELVIISAISSLTFFSLMIVLPSTFIEFQHKASILLNKVEICRVGFRINFSYKILFIQQEIQTARIFAYDGVKSELNVITKRKINARGTFDFFTCILT